MANVERGTFTFDRAVLQMYAYFFLRLKEAPIEYKKKMLAKVWNWEILSFTGTILECALSEYKALGADFRVHNVNIVLVIDKATTENVY